MTEDQIKAHIRMVGSRCGVHQDGDLWLVHSDKYAEARTALEAAAAAALKQYAHPTY